jgi:putative ABC transport system permease protein
MKPKPPLLASKFLKWFCAPHLYESIQGDLEEEYGFQVKKVGERKANLYYWWEVLGFVKWKYIKRKSERYSSNHYFTIAMLRNYIKIAWRSLLKNSFYSMINCLGLAIGLAVGILILLWVQDELSFDRFNKQASNIYKLENRVGTGSSQQIWTSTVAPIANFAKAELPEVQDAVRLTYNGSYTLFKYKDKIFNEENTSFTDPSLFKIFDFELIKGNPAKPFPDDHSVILTETTAKRYFGDEDPIGKGVSATNTSFTVSGIVKDFPENSSIQRDMFLPISLSFKDRFGVNKNGEHMEGDFSQFDYDTYLLLHPEKSVSSIADKLRNIHLQNKPEDTDVKYLLQPLTDTHLYKSDGTDKGIETVRMFIVISLLILTIACINYVNLSTTRSLLRSKEVSMRKIVGAARTQLFTQFLTETVLLFSLATVLAIILMFLLMPAFNQISGKQLAFDLTDYHIWQIICVTILGTLIASSIYPAMLLSSFEPLIALKGKVSGRINEAVFRKVLVVIQFSVSVILIAGTFVISSQMKYIRSKELGYDKTHVFSFYMRGMRKHYEAVKADLLAQPGISAVTRANHNVVRIGSQTGDNAWDGKETGETLMLQQMSVDKDFIPFFKMHLQQGANFTGSVSDSLHFILNEAAVKAARIENPIGKRFRLWKKEGTIIGVVKDFHFASMKQKIEPAIFQFDPRDMEMIYIKTSGKDAEKVIAATKKNWLQYNADFPFTYTFLDDTFNDLYKSEQRTGFLFNIFASIAILISCLGLFGLAAYTAQIRTREIGVRKVLGSSMAGIVQLLAKDLIKLVIIGIIIAVPIAWYAMDKWLKDFAYRIEVQWWVFALAGLLALTVALLTVSFQSIKAALMNPIKSLKSE